MDGEVVREEEAAEKRKPVPPALHFLLYDCEKTVEVNDEARETRRSGDTVNGVQFRRG